MRPIGYMYKSVASRPDSLNTSQVRDIYSLSGCLSHNFADYIKYWKHNGFWLFDSPSVIQELAAEHAISLKGLRLFYYEAYEREYDEDERAWASFEPDAFVTNVLPPVQRTLEGFDVTSFTDNTPECSPLSCNSLAATIPTNSHCLFRSFEEAMSAIENNMFERAEPGPYRIIAVYSVNTD